MKVISISEISSLQIFSESNINSTLLFAAFFSATKLLVFEEVLLVNVLLLSSMKSEMFVHYTGRIRSLLCIKI